MLYLSHIHQFGITTQANVQVVGLQMETEAPQETPQKCRENMQPQTETDTHLKINRDTFTLENPLLKMPLYVY